MSKILDKAVELGELIRDSQEMKNYAKMEIVYENDVDAQRLTREYSEMREQLAERAKEEDITPQEMLEIRKKLGQKYEEVSANPVIKEYLESKKTVEDILAKIDSIIKYYVTGEEEAQGSCGGNCSGCSGCH